MTPSALPLPPQIRLALILIWASILILSPIVIALDYDYIRTALRAAEDEMTVIWVSLAIGIAVCAFLLYQIGRGRNWARIIYMVLFLLSLLPFVPDLPVRLGRSIPMGIVEIVQYLMQAYALFLLFSSPGKRWFQSAAEPSPSFDGTSDSGSNPAASGAAPRSGFVTVVSWILIVTSVLGFVGAAIGAAGAYVMPSDTQSDPGVAKFIFSAIFSGKTPPAIDYVIDHAFELLSAAAGASALLCIASIGLLRRQRWARFAVMGLMAASIVVVVAAFGGLSLLTNAMAALALKDLAGEERKLAEIGFNSMLTGYITMAVLCAAPFVAIAVSLYRRDIRREFYATRQ